ncbi:MAG: hypothetical protein WCY01_08915 [Alkalispirochaeta sp.]
MGILRWAVPLLLPILFFTGCVSQLQQEESAQRAQSVTATGEPELAETPAEANTIYESSGPILTDLTDNNLLSYLDDTITAPYRIVRTPEEPLFQIALAPGTDKPVLMALVTDGKHLALYQDPLDEQGRSQGKAVTEIQAIDVVILETVPIAIDPRSQRPNGFHLTVTGPDRQGELFIIATPNGSYSVRTPYSTVNRTVLRDLNGDGLQELVQYSRVFEAGGRREIIVDAFEWDGAGFVHTRSLPVLRRVNERLRKLQKQLERAGSGETRFEGALQGEPGAPVPSKVLPPLSVRVPELAELTLDLGAPEWEFGHDIAIYHEDNSPLVYRIRLAVTANPYRPVPVTVIGLD